MKVSNIFGPSFSRSGKGLQVIKMDTAARGYIIFGIIVFFVVFIDALDFNDYFLALAGLGWLMMIVTGFLMGRIENTVQNATDKGKGTEIFTLSLVALLAFIAIDTWAPILIPVSLSAIPPQSAFTVGTLCVVLAAIAEETFFRFGVTNVFVKVSKSIFGAIIGSAVVFGMLHLAVYPSLTPIIIVTTAGGILALIDFVSQRLSTSITAHMLNNLLSVTYTVFVGGHSFFVLTPGGIIPNLLHFAGI